MTRRPREVGGIWLDPPGAREVTQEELRRAAKEREIRRYYETKVCRICKHDCSTDDEGLTFDHSRHICMTCAKHRAFGDENDKRQWWEHPDPNKETNDG